MIRLVLAFLLVVPLAAQADVPDPTKSFCDPVLIGTSSGTASPGFHVTVRNVGNSPKPGASVFVDFKGSPARPYQEQETGTTVDCTALSMTRIADGAGQVVFHARIAGFDVVPMAAVRMNGVLLKHVPVLSTDLDGDGTTDIRDLNVFRLRFLFGRAAPETDFNQNGITDGFDLERLRQEIFLRAQGTPCP